MRNKDTNLGKDSKEDQQVDNVKLSNFYYEKIIYQKACQCGFSLLVLALIIKCSYMRFNSSQWTKTQEVNGNVVNLDRPLKSVELEEDSKQLLMIANILSLFQVYNALITKYLELSWQKSKMQIHKDETFFTTGMYKWYLLKCIFILVQPYFFLAGHTYKDYYNERSKGIQFQVNDFLTVIQIFFTMFPIYIYIIELTNWTDPKAQRCCSIFGVKANFLFGLKALMLQDPILVVLSSFLFSLVQLSLCLQIFEREILEDFKYITTSMWNVVITLTTVGYGDYFPQTNAGRFIGIITAFWGVFFVSLFVVALTNTLDLEESELRAFILLRRLFTRKILRENACKMIQSRYVIRCEEKKKGINQDHVKIRKNELLYKKYQSDFQQNYQRLLAMNDQNAQNDRLQIGIDQLRQDIESLNEQQDKINNHLADITGNYDQAKDFLMTKLNQHNKWRKRYRLKNKKTVRKHKKVVDVQSESEDEVKNEGGSQKFKLLSQDSKSESSQVKRKKQVQFIQENSRHE